MTDKTLQDRLRLLAYAYDLPDCTEAADALDALEKRNKELAAESEMLAFLLDCHEINADQFYWLRKSEISHVIAALSDFMGAEASRKLDSVLGDIK